MAIEDYRARNDLHFCISAEDPCGIRLSPEASDPGLTMDVVLGQAIWSASGGGGKPAKIEFSDTPDGLGLRFENAFGDASRT